jgi:hypothetical protein
MTKYSLKNICLGIGIGLVLASTANISATPKRLSIDDIKREAKKYNLMVIDSKELIQKQPEPQLPIKPEVPEQKQTVVIEIESGTSSEEIAEVLLNNKLIKNKKEFLDRLIELKKVSKVQVGKFNISEGASIDKIIEIITSVSR